jgi:hypothetical protein
MSVVTFDQGQITVTTVATLIAPANPQRTGLIITNFGTSGSPANTGLDVFIGSSAVTYSNGTLLAKASGSTVAILTKDAVYGVVPSGQQVVSFVETFGTAGY